MFLYHYNIKQAKIYKKNVLNAVTAFLYCLFDTMSLRYTLVTKTKVRVASKV